MKKVYFLLAIASILMGKANAQSVAFNHDGSIADPSAIIDIKSSTKGLLIPRMTSSQREAIIRPANGILVFQIDDRPGFYYNHGTASSPNWKLLGSSLSSADALSSSTGAWLQTGNKNIDPAVHFIGTTDLQPLKFRVNGINAGQINPSNNNTAFGINTLSKNIAGTENTANGFQALFSNTTGNNSTANGVNVLYSNTTGSGNTANGARALFLNTEGYGNSATGFDALYSNTTGTWNTAMGSNALRSNTSGEKNTATGVMALTTNTSGIENTANGNAALFSNSTGISNTAIGVDALFSNSTGAENTGIGSSSLRQNEIGNGNTAIGSKADVISAGFSNATAIGYNSKVNASNKVRIGNAEVTVIEGQVPFTTPSDGRFKFNVQQDVRGLDFILKLRPVTYQFDVKRFEANMDYSGTKSLEASYSEAEAIRRTGFIAQEVERAANETSYDFSGIIKPKSEKEHYGLSYESFVVPLVKAVQEQQVIIVQQAKEMKQLKYQLAELTQMVQNISGLK